MQLFSALLLLLVLTAAGHSGPAHTTSDSQNYQPFEHYGGLVLSRTDMLPSRQTLPREQARPSWGLRALFEHASALAPPNVLPASVSWILAGLLAEVGLGLLYTPAVRWFQPLLRAPPHP